MAAYTMRANSVCTRCLQNNGTQHANTILLKHARPYPPGVDVGASLEQQPDDIDIASGGCQGEGGVVGHVAVLKVGSLRQQQLNNLAKKYIYYTHATTS